MDRLACFFTGVEDDAEAVFIKAHDLGDFLDGIEHLASDSDIVRILKSAGPLTVTDTSGVLPAATFTLKGSSRAIGMVERACYG